MIDKTNFEEVKEKLIALINQLGRIPKDKEIFNSKIIGDMRPIKRHFKQLGYDDWADYYREKGYKKINDIKVGDTYKNPHKINFEDIMIIIEDFYNCNNRYPVSMDFNTYYNEMPSFNKVTTILKENNIIWTQFIEGFGRFYPDTNKYDEYLKKFVSISTELNRALKYAELLKNDYNLPNANWFIKHCPDKNVTNYNQFIEYVGFKPRYNMSKELAIKLILEMQSKLNRPLMLEDFNDLMNDENKTIGISTINTHWGTMNKMKEELGLEIVQESMIDRQRSEEQMIEDMKFFISELGRLPTVLEINNNKNMVNACTYHNYFGGINNVFLTLGYVPNKKDISQHLTNEEIIQIYKDFVEDLNFTPTHDYCKRVYKLPSPKTVIRRLNCSWNDFMQMIGCVPNSSNKRGDICYAQDNTLCFSSAECLIHNYFLYNNINILSKEFFYRDLVEDNKELRDFIGYKRCDWILQHKNKFYIVEYFGLMGNYDYDERHATKLEFINKAGFQDNFIAIYPKDLARLNEIFNILK